MILVWFLIKVTQLFYCCLIFRKPSIGYHIVFYAKKKNCRSGFFNHSVSLIQSYLRGRVQTVFYNGEYSDYLPISSGVPQGSILGPILFSLYINDLPNVVKYCKIQIFADDVQLYIECGHIDVDNIAIKINADLKNVFDWARKNNLTLNVNKTHAMFISNRNDTNKPTILINNNVVNYVQSATSLGFKIQSNLDWDSFVLQQCGKIYGKLRTLQLSASLLPVATKLKLFKTLVLPYFMNCDFLLMQISADTLNRLRVALNACVRYVFKLSRFSHVSHLQHLLLGCSFENFCKLRCCQLVFKLTSTKKPDYLYAKLNSLRSARSKKFAIARHYTAKYGNSFFVRGVSIWNSLPNDLTLINSGSVFRKKCIEHFR